MNNGKHYFFENQLTVGERVGNWVCNTLFPKTMKVIGLAILLAMVATITGFFFSLGSGLYGTFLVLTF